ncbi:MAG: hypothetical protein A3C02_00390 [Candidatus Andersenbacteria bacterium RIFCSPHIGHO2_02_FULL_45_11]|uniref:DUF2283 domain-containing protein n=1 Tax=Candidatus Andersenbacteria bacterium RIFCSPHIGHO2_12_FULL_45_11 TaxID=1797281 RepID=A0A1G1X167_9BACT|nr:MAG: hypothetical protein A3D99_03155 [Candidatus Andersenbacteria bacterium RIFCSPHIGHO2_12_FULL_45_11]OGY34647.1 MAG: hypothetical protein A3C02_00390 [Candidatus Andersenbacteria bacterium RIFCSPHIGHO2_02_FULL_45_11]
MKKESKISYEPEADVLTLEISKDAPIDSAKEVGNIVVHFTHNNVPVLIEILEASSFLKQAEDAFSRTHGHLPSATSVPA